MNWFLAEMLRWGNGVLALMIFFGAISFSTTFAGPGGMFFGVLGGFVTATVICGILAILLDIRNKLGDIARNTARD
jgi:hypothetical protein